MIYSESVVRRAKSWLVRVAPRARVRFRVQCKDLDAVHK